MKLFKGLALLSLFLLATPVLSEDVGDNMNRLRNVRQVADDGTVFGVSQTGGRIEVQSRNADSTSVDAFGRFRVANPVNKFENKNIHDRSRNQWEEPIVGAIIVHGTVTSGPFQVAEIVTGQTSGTVGTVTAVDGGALTVTYTVNHNDFEDGETILGGTSGATAAITTSNTGSDITHSRANAAVTLQTGIVSGDSAVRTSHRYFPYDAGKSQEIGMTFLFGVEKTNVRRRVGYFDPDNGLYLEQTSGEVLFARRTSSSGSVVDNEISQASWNVNTFLTDTPTVLNPSGILLDFTKVQFVWFDFQWQGSGRVRTGFEVNGQRVVAHEFNLSNSLDTVYMSTPSLPVRYEISNTGATASVSTMKEFCTAVTSGGGQDATGVGFSVSRDYVERAVITTLEPILAIRLKSVYGGGDNRKTVEFISAVVSARTNEAHYEVTHIHDPTGITATWTDVGGGSAVEYSTDISVITGNPQHTIDEGYALAGTGGTGGSSLALGTKNDQHRILTQNIDSDNSEVFVVWAQSRTGTSNVVAAIRWVELD